MVEQVTATVPREVLVQVRAELRARSGHWARGFTADGDPIDLHDTSGPGGMCRVCGLLERLDAALHPAAGTEPAAVALNPAADRRVREIPAGVPLGSR